MALRGVDAEYVDANEEDGGVQFELLLDEDDDDDDESESLLGTDTTEQETHSSHSTTSQRTNKASEEIKDGFITILE